MSLESVSRCCETDCRDRESDCRCHEIAWGISTKRKVQAMRVIAEAVGVIIEAIKKISDAVRLFVEAVRVLAGSL